MLFIYLHQVQNDHANKTKHEIPNPASNLEHKKKLVSINKNHNSVSYALRFGQIFENSNHLMNKITGNVT